MKHCKINLITAGVDMSSLVDVGDFQGSGDFRRKLIFFAEHLAQHIERGYQAHEFDINKWKTTEGLAFTFQLDWSGEVRFKLWDIDNPKARHYGEGKINVAVEKICVQKWTQEEWYKKSARKRAEILDNRVHEYGFSIRTNRHPEDGPHESAPQEEWQYYKDNYCYGECPVNGGKCIHFDHPCPLCPLLDPPVATFDWKPDNPPKSGIHANEPSIFDKELPKFKSEYEVQVVRSPWDDPVVVSFHHNDEYHEPKRFCPRRAWDDMEPEEW